MSTPSPSASNPSDALLNGDTPDTRRAILDHLKLTGPLTAKALAERLDLTVMAIRLHLHALRDEGLIEGQRVPRKRGRPATAWALTHAANVHFPDTHDTLAVDLLTAMRETFGADGLKALLATRARKQLDAYRAALADAPDLPARVRALARERTREGYLATVKTDPDHPEALLLVEHHCPICSAARTCQGLCANELEVFRDALGPDAHIQRTEHMLADGRRCIYRVTPAT